MDSVRYRSWHELAILATIGMEASWIALWFRVFSHTSETISLWRTLIVLWGMMVGVYLLAHLMNVLRLRCNLRRALLSILLIGGVLFGIKLLLFWDQPIGIGAIVRRTVLVFGRQDGSLPTEFVASLMLIWIWWRGISLASRELDSWLVRRRFIIGVVMLFAYGLIAPVTGETPIAPLYLFLFSWLLSMSAARMHRLTYSGFGQAVSFNRKWLAGIFGVVLGVVGIAAVAAGLMEWKIASLVATALTWMFRAVFIVSAVLLSPIVFLLSGLMPWLQKWLANLPEAMRSVGDAMQSLGKMVEELRKTPAASFELPGFIRPVIFWAILGLAVFYAVWTLQKRALRSSPTAGEEPEEILTRGDFLRQFLSALHSGAQSLIGRLSGAQGLGRARRRLAAARVRRIYAQLLDLSASLGKPRPSTCTPLEYLPLLDALFPNHAAELRLITRAYLSVRYGELPESHQEMYQVEAAWKRIREQGLAVKEYHRMKRAPV